MKNRAFTPKSLIFSLIGLITICFFPAYAVRVLQLNNKLDGYLPLVPLFLIVLLSLGWNMLAGKLNRKFALSARELAVVFGLMLIISWIPAVQQNLVRQVVLPRYDELTTNISWQEAGVTTRMADRLFPQGEGGEPIGEKTHFGMIQGGMSRSEIPYRAWIGPLLNWMPFLIFLPLCLMALTFVVHRQWTLHEQLRYPLASVVDSLIIQDPKKPGGSIFKSGLFWSGFAFVFCFLLLRDLEAWFPGKLPAPPIEFSLGWSTLFPSIGPSSAGIFGLSWMPISFALIGIAFLVPTDVSLSIGLTAPLGTIFAVQYYLITGEPVSSGDFDMFRAGGFLAFGIILAYTGRTYYFPLFLKAIWPGRKGAALDPGGVWAARVFLVAYVALVFIVASMGVDFLMAFIIVSMVLLMFLVVTRLVCETGVPTIAAGWSLPGVLTGLMGTAAIGATPLMFMMFLGSTIIASSSSNLAMPMMATSLKLLDDNKVNLKRFAVFAKVAIIVALVAGFVTVITLSYTQGQGNLQKGERAIWSQGVRQVLAMMDFGTYEQSEAAHGLSKLALIRPDADTVGLVVTGLIVVLLCYLLRFRFAKWPLHPLFFVVIATGVASSWVCFLLGWAIKSALIKVGGARVYRSAKPIFMGMIMGEFMLFAVIYIIALVYYLITGEFSSSMLRGK